ncbi:MAG: phosphatase PAP2 family protein [Candidatus Thalassarchaeaceae archaeon]|nr:phosphatase PAP2 family protein [Candidatus Thalassarchaeaceae archaeon]
MAGGTGIYVTWVTGAIVTSVALMYILKPSWSRITVSGFLDMFRRYWMHAIIVFSIYIWKDIFDGIDRIIMANTRLDMTAYIYAIEGDIVLQIQKEFENKILTFILTHFYIAGYMMIMFSAFVYTCYFDDRHMADRLTLTILMVYMLALPFYLFFNVRVTGDYIPGMQTLGYNLTPEIQTWFTRIDPFTNGMPSLHIGMPFAIWYCYARNDLDGRWKTWRQFLVSYIILTAFTILYLGIHWVSDIIGGLLVGAAAVHVAEYIAPTIWRGLDERLFTHRLSWFLADWRRPFIEAKVILSRVWTWLKVPGSRQTGVAIMLLTASTAGVLLWDTTHQHFSAEGISEPSAATGADGWLASYESIDEGNISVTMWNLSAEESYQSNIGLVTTWGNYPVEILIGESHIVIWHGYQLEFFNISNNQWEGQWVTGPLFDDISMLSNGDAAWPHMVMLNGGDIEMRARGMGNATPLSYPPNAPVSLIATDAHSVAYVETNEPNVVHVQTISGIERYLSVEIDAKIDTPRDQQVQSMTDTIVDYENAQVTKIALEGNHLVALVNLTAVDRLVLVDLMSGDQRILGDPVFPVASPSIGHGHIAWQQQQFLISNDPNPDYLDWEVDFHIIADNRSYPLHTPDSIDQLDPQVMEDHIAWRQLDDDGNSEIRIFTIEVVLEPYSSNVLQFFVLLAPLLIVMWIGQRLTENEGHILSSHTEEE